MNKKEGRRVFFEKNKGGEDFFLEKGGEDFFSEKNRGRTLFFDLKKGGRRLFFRQIFPKTRPIGTR